MRRCPVSADAWWDYSGPLCDCPGELADLSHDESVADVPDAFDLQGLGGWLFTAERRPA